MDSQRNSLKMQAKALMSNVADATCLIQSDTLYFGTCRNIVELFIYIYFKQERQYFIYTTVDV